PTAPEFQLAGDSERVALTCADLGVRADELDLPVPLDRVAYRAAVERLEQRGIIEGGRLTSYGKAVEALPVERPWAELLVHADDDLVPYLAVAASIETLHRMTRDERDLEGLIVPGSDHLTAYNLYADAFRRHGSVGEVYGLPRHVFGDAIDDWAQRRGALVKAIEDAALGMASIYRAIGLPLPSRMTLAADAVYGRFADLVARIMPFDLVIGEQTARGDRGHADFARPRTPLLNVRRSRGRLRSGAKARRAGGDPADALPRVRARARARTDRRVPRCVGRSGETRVGRRPRARRGPAPRGAPESAGRRRVARGLPAVGRPDATVRPRGAHRIL